jgi:hypothetical protein
LPDTRPTRATTDGRAYLDLQNLAPPDPDELHQLYALEGFLARLTASDYSDRLVLKGGCPAGRLRHPPPTRDIDLLTHDLSNAPANMLTCMKAIASVPVNDGLNLDAGSASADLIRDDEEYAGVRVTMPGSLSIARIKFHIDVNIGDPVSTAPEPLRLPRILGAELVVTGYPLAMVLAEKIITMLQRRDASTRWRDFADVYTLSRCRQIDGTQLTASLTLVGAHRRVRLISLLDALDGMTGPAQPKWAAWRRKQRMEQQVPNSSPKSSTTSPHSRTRPSVAQRTT